MWKASSQLNKMPGGKYCCVCKNSYSKDPQISLHRFPSATDKRGAWLEAFGFSEEEVMPHIREDYKAIKCSDMVSDWSQF